MTISEILQDSDYKLNLRLLINKADELEKRITLKDVRGTQTPFVTCIVRKKDIKLTPEEVVRQLYIAVLHDDLNYPIDRMQVEYGVSFGREIKRADIVVFDKDKVTAPYILVELKKPKFRDTFAFI